MTGLDTHVLVRYLTQDDPGQARTATTIIEETITFDRALKGHPLFRVV
jgi:predicted nucleic-acid-binding protein